MSDLSQYIAFGIVLDNSGSSPVIRLIDTSAYPNGVAQNVKGCFQITQPDGITAGNSDFSAPDIYWNSGALVQASYPLRLANNQRFQNGGYLLTYTVEAAGYSDTTLTQTFLLNYTAPTLVLTPAFDNFTPSLKVTDATVYGQAGLNYISVSENWAGVINSVGGTEESVTGSGVTFDLAFGGSYYDAEYLITLTAIPQWQLAAAGPSVTIIDKLISLQETFYSEIPPTLAELLASLTVLKSQLDAAQNNGNIYGNSVYGNLLTTYNFAMSVYTHLIDRGQVGSLAGLSNYVYQLQQIFNNGITPPYTNTNTPIPAYNWGGGGSGSAWSQITGKPSTITITWVVGANGFPGAGATSISSAQLVGAGLNQILMFRGGFFYSAFTKSSQASNTLSWTTPLQAGENVFILILPL